MKSAPATELREYINLWLEAKTKEVKRDSVRSLLDANNFVFFFKKGNNLFAAPETSRVMFARMKNPDEETTEEAKKEQSFLALDLDSALEGEKAERIIKYEDLKELKVLDRDKVEEMLVKRVGDPKKVQTNMDKEEGPPDMEPGKKQNEL
jgi:hypothetical protein